MALKQGDVIDNRYQVLRELGRGGMSIVYLVFDMKTSKQYAAKEMLISKKDKDNINYKSLVAEASILKELDHKYLPSIRDVFELDHSHLIIMDFIPGITLREVLISNKSVDEELVVLWGIQLGEALDYLHNLEPAIIYRDMKPGNVMLQDSGDIKLFDFGISREVTKGGDGETVALGTLGYAAPEQTASEEENRGGQFDERTDIYALGMTLYHLVTGHNPNISPQKVQSIRKWDSTLSEGLEFIIDKATKQNPDERYQTVKEMIYDLERYHELEKPFIKKQQRKRRLLITTYVLTLGLLITSFTTKRASLLELENSFNTYMAEAALSKDADLYYEALKLKGNELDVYNKLIDNYKIDGVFTKEEEENFIKYFNDNVEELSKHEDFSDTAFEIGKLYWFYYENDNEGRVKSNTWFKTAVQDTNFNKRNTASNYAIMSDFYTNIARNIKEADDATLYKGFWDSLSDMYSNTGNQLGELMNLKMVEITYDFLSAYGTSLKNDGVTKKEVVDLVKISKQKINDAAESNQQIIELKEKLKNYDIDSIISRIYDYREVEEVE